MEKNASPRPYRAVQAVFPQKAGLPQRSRAVHDGQSVG
ncbi:hypothetical protein B0I31_12612 [Saccharothrix carnea]|uniref:Uncharacterized protein n=1 Tax=Saccharothrix carnea TaxID=1280637 RepID=A0A2P8HIE5_SACCR|nr:hypothetical protein B0I31_12612 [Saccharothrix carnea]